ncbi:nuclear transport factor 2 family protein [Gordonia liuliyuniae]|uniref:Nuclear transport factor 2 family protein n=1 Tax=Gordonia liuliyuniae TaxID=2911517 RepID=A0ABS9ISD7_9ACTN|nr:nuclear transport factor 2 family protein [Gordonia liuliyuniae]MCF8588432.1 nuclear transport factor 2 family protein [Gordonia liuliyuniae]
MTETFSAEELDAAFTQFQKTVADVADHRDWDVWADQFTEDADYVEHAYGTMHGREEIRVWINKTMNEFPGSHMTGYPSLWHVTDPSTGRVICEVDNPMRDPGDGSQFTATNITILTYAGDGLWSCEEDVYNPMKFGLMARKWCDRAAELGTLDAPARQWLETTGAMFGRRK